MNISGEMIPLIRQAIEEGNIEDVVNLILKTGDKESLALFKKFSEAQKKYESKLIDLEEWVQTQAQICHYILGTDYMQEAEMPKSPSLKIKVKIVHLLLEYNTEQALALCNDFGNPYLMLQAELNAVKNQAVKGLLASEYFEATKSKISFRQ